MQTKKSTAFIRLCKKYDVDPVNIPEIKTFEEACLATKTDPKKLPVVKGIVKRHQKRIIADYKLSIIAEAIREGKNVDYTGTGQTKYFPIFRVKADKKRPSGFGLSYDGYGGWYSRTGVGVRLCFSSVDQAIYFGKHFIKLHEEHQLLL